MAAGLLSIPVPNFVSGVSQQPDSMALPTSAKVLDNGWPSVISGQSKRPNTEWLAKLPLSVSTSAIGTILDRVGVAQFVCVLVDGQLKVYDLDGNEKTVYAPEGFSYLQQATDPISAFKFLTLGDTTFILNKEVQVKENAFGEVNNSAYTPAGEVYTFSALPTGVATDSVYRTRQDGLYWRYILIPATASTFGWEAQGGFQDSVTAGFGPVVEVLPDDSTPVGSYVWLHAVQAYSAYNPGIWGLIPLSWYTAYRDVYRLFRKATMTPSMTDHHEWQQVSVAGLVTELNNGRLNPNGRASVYIVNAVGSCYYSVYINNALAGQYLSPDGSSSAAAIPGTSTIAAYLSANLTSAGWANTVKGSTICLTGLNPSDTIKCTATMGDKAIRGYTKSVNSFSDLPPNELDGRIVKVRGDLQSKGDDYYVVFNRGVWEETYGYDEGAGLISSTMPHKLVWDGRDTFTFTPHFWRSKEAGDKDSNKGPSFRNQYLLDMFMFSNRMGFLTRDNLVLSETDRYENFYRTTLASLQDSDPLDYAIITQNDDSLRHAIVFNKDLLLMADKSQYRFTYTQFVGPKNIQVQFTTSFNVARNVTPLNMGASVYFVDDAPTYEYGKVWEYFPRPNQQGDDADEATAAIPQFIKSGITFFAGSPRMNVLLVGSKGDPTALYFYKYFWNGDKKIQNAWSRWSFPDCEKVLWGKVNNNYVYLLLKRADGVHLERIRLDEELITGDTTRVLLDRFTPIQSTSMTYDSATDRTTITLPWSTTVTPEVVASSDPAAASPYANIRLNVVKVNGSTITVDGDRRYAAVVAGIPYTHRFIPATPYLRAQAGNGQTSVLDGRLQVRWLNLEYHMASYFKCIVSSPGRADKAQVFDGTVRNRPDVVLNKTPVLSGQIKLPIMQQNLQMRVTLENDSPFNASYGSGEWMCLYQPKTKRT